VSKTPHQNGVVTDRLSDQDECLHWFAHRNIHPRDLEFLRGVGCDHHANVVHFGVQKVWSELVVDVGGTDMTLEKLVYERHEVGFHDVGDLVLVVIDDRYVAFYHFDQLCAERHF
jgi:hypothetical protein